MRMTQWELPDVPTAGSGQLQVSCFGTDVRRAVAAHISEVRATSRRHLREPAEGKPPPDSVSRL